MSKPTEKVLYESEDKCPWCSKLIRTRVVRTTLTPGEKAETETTGSLEKVTQSTLEEDFKAEQSKTKKKVKRKAV